MSAKSTSFNTINFQNWTFPTAETITADFTEYKGKEDRKWRGRAEAMGFRFPMFPDRASFESALRNAQVVTLTPEHDAKIANRSHCQTIEQLKRLVGHYQVPRDVDRIVNGYMTDAPIPYPIVIRGTKGDWIMAGNTRLVTAFILGVSPKVLLVDISG